MSANANNIFKAFARATHRVPDAEALIYRDRRWTYADLHAAATRAATGMFEAGVSSGDRVAFLAHNSDVYVIGFLATQLLGAIHVPLNFRLEVPEILYILDHCSPKFLYSDTACMPAAEFASAASIAKSPVLEIENLGLTETAVTLAESGGHRDASTAAQLAYTSGTESRPKGALLSDNGLLLQYMSCIEAGDYTSSDVVVHAMPLYHCAQMHCFLLPSLLLGARNVLLEGAEPAAIIDAIRRHQATSFFAPPTVWIGILADSSVASRDLSGLKKGYYGASIMPREVLAKMRIQLPWLGLWNYYGQTEIGPLATALRPQEHARRPASVGRPVLFVETRIVDDEMRTLPPGAVGEIVHRSPQLLLEYYHDPQKTAEAFQDGWFRSGDLGVADDEGYLTVVDRKKDMIKTGGENVASREVEEVIYQHPAVSEVAVIGLPDARWVERVCAFVVLRPGSEADASQIIAHTACLASFKRPKQVIFVRELPKNPSGKIMKRELRKWAAAICGSDRDVAQEPGTCH